MKDDVDDRPAIEVLHLEHAFKNRPVLNDVGFRVAQRSIHGFVGPNGAGKTTTLKILATLLAPTRGSVRVAGLDVRSEWRRARQKIGFMPDHLSMYRQMTVFEDLDFFGAAYGLARARRERIIGDILTLTDMSARRDDLIRALSRGMMQRVSLARVLVNDPEVLLLDEPASGLDPRARIELMEILRELRKLGKTVFISSHILSELADLCDSVTIIDRGSIKYSGGMSDLLEHEGEKIAYVLEVRAEDPALESALRALPTVESVGRDGEERGYFITTARGAAASAAILRAVLDAGSEVISFRADRRHLNQVFLDLTEPGVH